METMHHWIQDRQLQWKRISTLHRFYDVQSKAIPHWYQFSDKHPVYTLTWKPRGKSKATVLFLHGLGEHISRYHSVFSSFAQHGIQITAFDQRGFGKTGAFSSTLGHMGDIHRMIQDVQDVNSVIEKHATHHFIMGHRYVSFNFIKKYGWGISFKICIHASTRA